MALPRTKRAKRLMTGSVHKLGRCHTPDVTGPAVRPSGMGLTHLAKSAKAIKELADKGYKTRAIRCDVSDDAQVEAMVQQTVATFGQLDAAYNNAGVQNVLAETADSPRDDYDRVMTINLRGEAWSNRIHQERCSRICNAWHSR